MSFSARELSQIRELAKGLTAQTFSSFMRVGGKGDLNVTMMFVTMVSQLALARVLEEQLLKTLAKCPDAGLSAQVEELAAQIAAELTRASDAAMAGKVAP
jgi:hypothetical protein